MHREAGHFLAFGSHFKALLARTDEDKNAGGVVDATAGDFWPSPAYLHGACAIFDRGSGLPASFAQPGARFVIG